MKKLIFLLAIFPLLFNTTFSQISISDTLIVKFLDKIKSSGLNQVISYENIELTDELILLKLKFNYSDSETNCFAWESLKKDFKSKYNYGIENYLFFQFIDIFNVTEPEKAAIVIRKDFSTDELPKIACHFDKVLKKVVLIQDLCMGEVEMEDDFNLKEIYFLNEKFVISKPKVARDVLYKMINNNMRLFYKRGGFEKKSKPKYISYYKPGKSELKFEVKNLKQEVLHDRGNHFICRLLRLVHSDDKYCDWRSFEHLKFTILYTYDSNHKEIKLQLKLEGRYGSGPHGTNSWRKMKDMDPTFINHIEDYKERVFKKIEKILTE